MRADGGIRRPPSSSRCAPFSGVSGSCLHRGMTGHGGGDALDGSERRRRDRSPRGLRPPSEHGFAGVAPQQSGNDDIRTAVSRTPPLEAKTFEIAARRGAPAAASGRSTSTGSRSAGYSRRPSGVPRCARTARAVRHMLIDDGDPCHRGDDEVSLTAPGIIGLIGGAIPWR